MEKPPMNWDEIVAGARKIADKAILRSPKLAAFQTKLKEQTALYLEMNGAFDPAFYTDGSSLDSKLLLAWLVSAESAAVIEVQLEWRVLFCATCFENHPKEPYHVTLSRSGS
jgi:hypothetical protein